MTLNSILQYRIKYHFSNRRATGS